jgi:DNA-binding transcriptional regulator YiaG
MGMKPTGKNVAKKLRTKYKLTQKQAASLIYRSWRCWQSWELNDRKIPKICAVLFEIRAKKWVKTNLTVSEFLEKEQK